MCMVCLQRREDCFIIPKEPKTRTGVSSNPVKNNLKSGAHIMNEFGLQLFRIMLKAEKLKTTQKDFKLLLDPIVPLLASSLESQQVKVRGNSAFISRRTSTNLLEFCR